MLVAVDGDDLNATLPAFKFRLPHVSLLLQQNQEWFDILLSTYCVCLGNWLLKESLAFGSRYLRT